MKALRVLAPHTVEIQEVPDLIAGRGQLLVDVERVGICGTDVELYTGEMEYYRSGRTTFPVQLGHEWVGTVSLVGAGVTQSWIGKRVTGDTMLGCGLCAGARVVRHISAMSGSNSASPTDGAAPWLSRC